MVTIKDLAREINEVLNSDRDFPMVVSGTPGEGKSTFDAQLGMAGDKRFTFPRNFIYSRKQFLNSLDSLEAGSYISSDESSNVGHKREGMKHWQMQVIKKLDMVRDSNFKISLVLPDIWSLDREILRRIKAWVFIGHRGIAHIFKPDFENPFCQDPWHRKYNEKRFKNWNPRDPPLFAKGYIDTIYFNDLEPKNKKAYLSNKHEGRKLALKEATEVERDNTALMARSFHRGYYYALKWLNSNKLLVHGTLKKLAEADGISYDAYRMRVTKAHSILEHINEETENEQTETLY